MAYCRIYLHYLADYTYPGKYLLFSELVTVDNLSLFCVIMIRGKEGSFPSQGDDTQVFDLVGV